MGEGEKKSGGNKKFQKSYFDVLGLCCSSEVPLIEKILKPLDGVKDVSVIVPTKTVIVVHDNLIISQLDIAKALNQARLEANVRVYGESNYQKKWPSPYAIACGVFLVLSFLKYVYRPFQWLALGAVAIGICPIFLKGLAAMRNYTLDTNILALIAVIGSVALHDYWEAGSIVFLFTIAQWLESRASHKANAVMSSLMNIVPQKATLAETGEEVDADEVEVNTILAIKAGEIIPIDGIVVDGECDVDEKTLTGESFPVSKQNDSTVWAGTINLNGYISVRTTALAEDCVVARMAKLVEEAQNNKSKTQRFIDKCAKFYTPIVVAISVSLAVIPAILRVHNQNKWFHLALVVLVSACPCALILSTPVATFCALSKAATSGLLIKGGEYLETLSKIKIMAFDKTGTITRGEFIVTKFQSLSDDVSLNTLLYWVSSIESKSSHPMAAALIDYGQSHFIKPMSENVEEFENFPGEGVRGKIDGKDVYVGNVKIALRAGCSTVPSLVDDTMNGKSIGYIFLEARPAGVFSLSDTCRTGAKEAINELRSMGIKTAMLTGDNLGAATLAQSQLAGALELVHAELLPQDKARIIKEFQEEAPTAMVGDGLNDAPALAAADIGISMGISGSALATETGNVILMSNDIRKLPTIIQLARRTHRKVIVNVILSILAKVAILALAFAGYPLVWAAVLADNGTCLVVIFNSMLLLRGNNKLVTKCCKSSDSKAQTVSKPQKCSQRRAQSCQVGPCNSSPCDNKMSSNSVDVNGCCARQDQLQKEAKHSDQESCDIATGNMGSNGMHKNGCTSGPSDAISCVEKKCTNIVGRNDICVADMTSCCSVQNHLSLGSSEISQSMTTNGHCHLIRCNDNHIKSEIVDEEQGNFAETSCRNPNHEVHSECRRQGEDNCSSLHAPIDISSGNDHKGCATTKACQNLKRRQIGGCCKSVKNPNHEVHSECRRQGEDNCSSLHAPIDISSGNDHKGCATTKACQNLKRRQIGGCCKSVKNECCSRSGHFGATFGGGFTGILIE